MGFTPFHRLVTAHGARPDRCLLLLHGFLGRGANWGRIARALTAARPDWAVALVDLRHHGHSRGAPPPTGVRAAARDLLTLDREIAALSGAPPAAVAGHSLGAQVAIDYAALRRPDQLAQLWILDADPAPRTRGESRAPIEALLDLLGRLQGHHGSRSAFRGELIGAGVASDVADWLGMNLERRADGLVLDLEMEGLRQLLADYRTRDSWRLLDGDLAARTAVIVGGVSEVVDETRRARWEAWAARRTGRSIHVIPAAGHWLHRDAPEALVGWLARGLVDSGSPRAGGPRGERPT